MRKRWTIMSVIALCAALLAGLAVYVQTRVFAQAGAMDDLESIAHMLLEVPLLGQIDVDMTGPTMIQRGPRAPGTGIIETEMIQLSLVGGGDLPHNPAAGFFDVFVELDPSRRSMGQIRPLAPGGRCPCASFFEVNVMITASRDGQPLLRATNPAGQPLRVEATIDEIPPIDPKDPYKHVGGRKALVDPATQQQVAALIAAQHIPVLPSHAKIKRELIRIERKLAKILQKLGP